MTTRYTNAELANRLLKMENEVRILRRKSQGITSAHKRVSQLADRMDGEIAELRKQLSDLGPIPELATRIGSHESSLADLTISVRMLEEGQESLSERITLGLETVNGRLDEYGRRTTDVQAQADTTAGSVAFAHERIDTISGDETFNGLAAAIVGAVMLAIWLFWFLPTNFGSEVTVKGRPTGAVVGSQLDTLWGALVGLIVVVLAATAAGYLFMRSGRYTSAFTTSYRAARTRRSNPAVTPPVPAPAPAAAATVPLPAQPAPVDPPRSFDVVPAGTSS